MRRGGRKKGLCGSLIWAGLVLLYSLLLADSLETTETSTESDFKVEPGPTIQTWATSPRPPATTLNPKHEHSEEEVIPTWRPKRENCTPPAIEQFPNPIIGPTARRHGAVIIHLIICIYSFIGLAIVCDDYFVASLDRICEELKLSPDVAGATFMAAGSSAPELATVVIGVFFAKDDIGVSGVIGSAVFNIMFVISICAIFAGTVCYLNWWPLCRDTVFYSFSILTMVVVIFDEKISWMESAMMLLFYVCYCVALAYNTKLEEWARRLPLPCKDLDNVPQGTGGIAGGGPPPQPSEESRLVTYKNLEGGGTMVGGGMGTGGGFGMAEDPYNQPQEPQHQVPSPLPNGDGAPPRQPMESATPHRPDYYRGLGAQTQNVFATALQKPENPTKFELYKFYAFVPIHWLAQNTMPDLSQDKYKNWYPFNFIVSMIWISFYSYIMVWMITVIGSTLGIPDTVMGLTFVAAGVSVPDALSSLAVVKEGYGDMAVANAIGSNVFDIFVCLGLPWFIQTAIIKPGSHVNVYSKGLLYSTLSLLSTVIFLLGATHMNGWKLDKKYGYILMLWYLAFICFASLYELNVFGMMNPPECPSDY